jgi:hypothetical protein
MRFTKSKWSPTGIQRSTPGGPGGLWDIRAALDERDTSPPFQGEKTIESMRRDSAICQACALGRAHTQAVHEAGPRASR